MTIRSRLGTAARRVVRIAVAWGRWLRSPEGACTLRPLAPGALAVCFAPFLYAMIRQEIKEPLFGDVLVFQYTGWCLRHGLRLYRDVGMADGPFIHYLHAGMQVFAGLSDRGFREADLVLHVFGSGAMGALLAPAPNPTPAARLGSRIAWGAAAAAVWLSWYFTETWAETGQREMYYSLFGSLGLVLVYVSDRWERRAALGMFLGGFLTTTQAFGKPTGLVAYFAIGLLVASLPGAASMIPLRSRLRAFGAGALACVLAVLFAFLVSGSFAGYLLWCWKIMYVGNWFLFRHDYVQPLFAGWENYRTMGVVALAFGTAAIASGWLPGRAIGFVLLPAILFVGACLQARGYPYQFAPVVAHFHLLAFVALAALWERSGAIDWPDSRSLVGTLFLGFIAYYTFTSLQASTFRWNGDPKSWKVASQQFAEEEKKVGVYIRDHTRPTDRVFSYSQGENAHVVLLKAERATATPFFHSFWLDPVGLLPQSVVQPNAKELAALTELQTEIRATACSAVERNEPAAMAFNNLEQVFKVCPNVKGMLSSAYAEATTIGSFHVYLRRASGG
jgi:hypothetical protein